jgi:hypothetical protein
MKWSTERMLLTYQGAGGIAIVHDGEMSKSNFSWR